MEGMQVAALPEPAGPPKLTSPSLSQKRLASVRVGDLPGVEGLPAESITEEWLPARPRRAVGWILIAILARLLLLGRWWWRQGPVPSASSAPSPPIAGGAGLDQRLWTQ